MVEELDAGNGRILIRQASMDDLDRIVPLFDAYRQFYKQPSDPALARSFLGERFRNNQSVIFLALDSQGSSPLGFTQLYPSFSSGSCRPIYILNDLFVVTEARRRKIGYLLLQSAAEFGRKAGAARLTLSTALDNATRRLSMNSRVGAGTMYSASIICRWDKAEYAEVH